MKKKILLIDDDILIHESIRIIIEKSGFQFFSAYNGREGLDKILNKNPDIIILDLVMPEKTGVEIYRDLRTLPSFHAHRNIPVIMLTGATKGKSEIKKLLHSGLNAYLEKPFGSKELLNIIENIFVTHEIKIRSFQLKKAIKKSKNFLENLVASCPVAIITTNNNGIITFISKYAEELFGYSAQELIGQSFGLLVSDNNDESNLSFPNPGNHLYKELNIQSKLGNRIPMGITFTVLRDHHEQIKGWLIVAKDLSNQKRLEEELIEKKRLEAIAESLATINHQINNPLTPILGNLQLIRQTEDALPECLIKKLEIIEINAKRIFAILQQFNQVINPVRRKYYGNSHILDLKK